jgi:hypothetical protein
VSFEQVWPGKAGELTDIGAVKEAGTSQHSHVRNSALESEVDIFVVLSET